MNKLTLEKSNVGKFAHFGNSVKQAHVFPIEKVIGLAILFLIFSFAGFFYERVCNVIKGKPFMNNAFLGIPFTPIYGFSVLLVYFVLGTPDNNKIFNMIIMRVKKPMSKPQKTIFSHILLIIFWALF